MIDFHRTQHSLGQGVPEAGGRLNVAEAGRRLNVAEAGGRLNVTDRGRGGRAWRSVFPGKFPPVLSTPSHTAKYLLAVLLATMTVRGDHMTVM